MEGSRRLTIERSGGCVCKLTCYWLRNKGDGKEQLANTPSTSLNLGS